MLFATNYLAVSGLEMLGRPIPKQIAVVSFDDNDLLRLYLPPITVGVQPMEALAESIINALLSKLKSSTATGTQVQLALQLVIRSLSLRQAAV